MDTLRKTMAMICLVLAAGAPVLACAPWQIGAEKNVVKNGIRFDSFREGEDGQKLGILAGDTVIDGWPCRKGFVVLHGNWKPDELQLAKGHRRNGIDFPAKTWVFVDEQGNPKACMLPRDLEIQGHRCRGGWGGKEGVMVSFYPGGALKYYCCREDPVIDGVPCDGSMFHCGITLHENGRLKQCRLAEDTTIGGVAYSKGSVLRFAGDGTVVEER